MDDEPMVEIAKDVLEDVQNQLQQAMAILKQTQGQLEVEGGVSDESLAIAGAHKLLQLSVSDLEIHSSGM